MACGDFDLYGYTYVYLDFDMVGASSFMVATTVNNQTTTTTYPNSAPYMTLVGNLLDMPLLLPLHQSYTFQVRACYGEFGCLGWSPHVSVNTYDLSLCKPNYVFRMAYPYDQVCVTPNQQAQVALDNSLAASRINPNGAYGPKSCINGYVWRDTIGADYVCVTPGERAQVSTDNSQSVSHVQYP